MATQPAGMSAGDISRVVGGDASGAVDHLFRHESAKMVATLTGIFGIEHLALVEDVVQEALVRALQTWPFYGVPKNPAAWIMRASRNLALDAMRRQKVFRQKESQIIQLMERGDPPDQAIFDEQEIADETLRMMFVCCHPQIPADAQAALALKTLCGFSPAEISRAFLTTEAAIAKRLTRAKQKIRASRIRFEIPSGESLRQRLDGVLHTLYLLFNEGYKASSGDKLVREDLCREAIRLAEMLAAHPAGDQPKTHALLALLLLDAARIPARTDGAGNLLLLQQQQRSRWDQPMIAKGMWHLSRSAAGEELSVYHLEAGIAACHCAAADYQSTDWRRILSLYDRLVEMDPSPVVRLNRAIVIAHLQGPAAGLAAIAEIRNLAALETYYLLHAVLGEFESLLDHPEAAGRHFQKSLDLAQTRSEKSFLAGRLKNCEDQSRGLVNRS